MCCNLIKMKGKIIVLSAPSGTGKSTLISELMNMDDLKLSFSISATSRKPRGAEKNGREYWFLTSDEFKQKIDNDEFVEWEEVYSGTCYGTLVSEVDRVTANQKNLIMDIDVKGALNVKERFRDEVLSIFIMPPSLKELESRLRGRSTDDEESIMRRLERAEYEMTFADKFDCRVVNDNLSDAVDALRTKILEFISK